MVFSSIVFLCAFMPAVMIIYSLLSLLRNKIGESRLLKLQNALLLVTSLLFYAYGEPVYIILMCAAALISYLSALLIDRTDGGTKKLILSLAVIIELGILAVYKYAGMFAGLFGGLLGISLPPINIALPIGISFYTFQTLSYVIDVYRKDTKAQKSFFTVLLYVSFFPQLIAGPIIRYHDIEEQLASRRQTLNGCAVGMKRFCFGLAKKVLIANNVAVAADAIFNAPSQSVGAGAAWLAALAYMLQIYFDFSGYSDMAIGLGSMFGFTIGENFNSPYVSGSIKEFWRRWHISLSTWFREYLYIPLGGNRKGKARTAVNKLIVFSLTGLWHGANLTFLLWGLYHGILLTVEDSIRSSGIKIKDSMAKAWEVIRHIYLLLAVCLGFVLFRAESVGQAFTMISRMFGAGAENGSVQLALGQLTPLFITAFIAGVIVSLRLYRVLGYFMPSHKKSSRVAEYAGYAAAVVLLVFSVVSLSGNGYNPFIYFKF